MSEHDRESASGTYRRELSEEEEEILSNWWQALLAHDVRLSSKKLILKLAARSMADPEFRARLVNDFPSLRAEMPADFAEAELPAGVDLNFLENTEHTLNIVLPRPLEAVAEQDRPALRELLRSRTAAERSSFFQDDFRDHGNWDDWGPFMTPGDQGDVTRDAAVVLPE
jgi:hypothetical protein